MIHPGITALARLSRQERISCDEIAAMGAPSECLELITTRVKQAGVKTLREHGIHTQEQLDVVLGEPTLEELEALLKQIGEEIPNPFEWTPPTEPFCSFCHKRPHWWVTATWSERNAKGYRRKLVDFENQEVELQYCGRTVCCEECQAASDEQMDDYEAAIGIVDHHPDPYHDEAVYRRHYLEMSIVSCLNGEGWER